MSTKKHTKDLRLIEAEDKGGTKQNRVMGTPTPAVVANYTIPKELEAVRDKYGLPGVLPRVLKSTLVARILNVSRPTAIKMLKTMSGVKVSDNLKRDHLRIEAPLFMEYLRKNMDGSTTPENAGN